MHGLAHALCECIAMRSWMQWDAAETCICSVLFRSAIPSTQACLTQSTRQHFFLLCISTFAFRSCIYAQLRTDNISICVATGDQRATTEWVVHHAGIAPETSRAIEVRSVSIKPMLVCLWAINNLRHFADQQRRRGAVMENAHGATAERPLCGRKIALHSGCWVR